MACSRLEQSALVLIPFIILGIAVIGVVYLSFGPMQITFSKDENVEKYCVITGIATCIIFIFGASFCIAENLYERNQSNYNNNMEASMEEQDTKLMDSVRVNVCENDQTTGNYAKLDHK